MKSFLILCAVALLRTADIITVVTGDDGSEPTESLTEIEVVPLVAEVQIDRHRYGNAPLDAGETLSKISDNTDSARIERQLIGELMEEAENRVAHHYHRNSPSRSVRPQIGQHYNFGHRNPYIYKRFSHVRPGRPLNYRWNSYNQYSPYHYYRY